jgi:hypothetical protein
MIGVYMCMAIGLAAVTRSIRTFYPERVVYWREASSGANKLSYFLAKNLADLETTAVCTLVFLCFFFMVTSPSGGFGEYYLLIFLYECCLFGVGNIPMLSFIVTSNRIRLCMARGISKLPFGCHCGTSVWSGDRWNVFYF